MFDCFVIFCILCLCQFITSHLKCIEHLLRNNSKSKGQLFCVIVQKEKHSQCMQMHSSNHTVALFAMLAIKAPNYRSAIDRQGGEMEGMIIT